MRKFKDSLLKIGQAYKKEMGLDFENEKAKNLKNQGSQENQNSQLNPKFEKFADFLGNFEENDGKYQKKDPKQIEKESQIYKQYQDMINIETEYDRSLKQNKTQTNSSEWKFKDNMENKPKENDNQTPNNNQDQNNKDNQNQDRNQNINNNEQNQQKTTTNVPFMITKQMKLDLYEMGFSVAQIQKLTPIQAHEILNDMKKQRNKKNF